MIVPETASARRRSLALVVATGVALVVAALVVLVELVVLPRVIGLPRDAWLMGFVARGDVDAEVPLNAMGMTGDIPRGPKQPGDLRGLTLGGSVLFNRQMTSRLHERLDTRFEGRLELLGAALRAHTTWSSVHKWRLLRDADFDFVLLLHGINDLYANHVAPEHFREDYAHLEPWYRRGFLLDRSVIARVVYNELLWRRPPHELMGSGQRAASVFAANLERLVREIRAEGARPVLMTFAWWIPPDYSFDGFVAGELAYANPERYDYCPVELWGPVQWVREGLTRHNVAIHELAHRESVDLIDMQRLLGSEAAWFGDVCHPSEAGADVFADHVAAWLEAQGVLAAR